MFSHNKGKWNPIDIHGTNGRFIHGWLDFYGFHVEIRLIPKRTILPIPLDVPTFIPVPWMVWVRWSWLGHQAHLRRWTPQKNMTKYGMLKGSSASSRGRECVIKFGFFCLFWWLENMKNIFPKWW